MLSSEQQTCHRFHPQRRDVVLLVLLLNNLGLSVNALFLKMTVSLPPKDRGNFRKSNGIALHESSSLHKALDWDEENGKTQYSIRHSEATAAAATFMSSTRDKLVVFDKDGTLGDCTSSLRRWVYHMTDRIQQFLQCDTEETKRLIDEFHTRIGWDSASNNVVPSAPVAAGTWADQISTVYEFLVEHKEKSVEGLSLTRDHAQAWHDELGSLHGQDAPLIDDLRGMMLTCRSLGYKVCICTSDDRPATDAAMRFWNIQDVVDVSICGNEVAEGKPSAVPLHAVCRQASTESSCQYLPEDCIMIGDTTADTGMARNAQAGFCVGVLTGSGTTEQLLETGAHMIVPHVGHIPSLLRSFESFTVKQGEPQ